MLATLCNRGAAPLQLIPQPVRAELREGHFAAPGCKVTAEGFASRPEGLIRVGLGTGRPARKAAGPENAEHAPPATGRPRGHPRRRIPAPRRRTRGGTHGGRRKRHLLRAPDAPANGRRRRQHPLRRDRGLPPLRLPGTPPGRLPPLFPRGVREGATSTAWPPRSSTASTGT